jgi:hypothetical protein
MDGRHIGLHSGALCASRVAAMTMVIYLIFQKKKAAHSAALILQSYAPFTAAAAPGR